MRFVASPTFDVIPRVQCDPVMRAAAFRAAESSIAELERLGFTRSILDGLAIEWEVAGPPAAYEGASIGVAIALATAALVTGTTIDRDTVVSGAVESTAILKVSGIVEKYRAVASTGFARLLIPAESRKDLPPEARSAPRRGLFLPPACVRQSARRSVRHWAYPNVGSPQPLRATRADCRCVWTSGWSWLIRRPV